MGSITDFVLNEIKKEKNKETLVAIINKDSEIPVFLPESLLKYIQIKEEKVEIIGYRTGGRNVYVPNESLSESGIKLPFYSKYGIEIKGAGTRFKDLQHLKLKAYEKLDSKEISEEDSIISSELKWFGDKPIGGQSSEFAKSAYEASKVFDKFNGLHLISRTLAIIEHNYSVEGKNVWEEIREFYPGFRAQKVLYAISFDEIPEDIIRERTKDILVKGFINLADFSYTLLNYSFGLLKKRYLYTLGLIPSKDVVFGEEGAKVVDTESILITNDKDLSFAQATKFVKDLGTLSYLLARRFNKDYALDLLEAMTNSFSLVNQEKGKYKIVAYVNPIGPNLETAII